jgi:arylsulfatase A-like enzyme
MPVSAWRSLARLIAGPRPGDPARSDAPGTPTAEETPRPNIVFMITDDARDSDWQALPKTRRDVADKGTMFPNFFLTTAVCSPSRTSILTGMYAHNHQILRNDGPNGGFAQFVGRDLADVSISAALHAVGYRTGLFGKFLNGLPEEGPVPGGWDQWMATSELAYYGFVMNDNGDARKFTQNEDYSTDVLRARAAEFIRTTPEQQPLFMVFTAKAPHNPWTPAHRDRGKYWGTQRTRTPDFNEEDVSDKPSHVRALPALSDEEIAQIDREEQHRLESLIATDDAMEEIVLTLEATGRLANTYIFALSDNGWAAGSHRWHAKDPPYNELTRVMMAVTGPRFEVGSIDNRIAANIDLAATVAELAGVPFGGDGVSLLQETTRDAVVLEAWSVPYAALRTERYMYVEYGWGERELYDYELDPYELDNLLADWEGHTPSTEAEETAALLKPRLDALRWCAGSRCR